MRVNATVLAGSIILSNALPFTPWRVFLRVRSDASVELQAEAPAPCETALDVITVQPDLNVVRSNGKVMLVLQGAEQ